MGASVVIEVKDIKKNFMVGKQQIDVLKGITFNVHMGDFLVILGPSGCGKSTLLHVILGLEEPSSGTIRFLDRDLYEGTDEDIRSEFRKYHVGMIYQQPNWVKSMNVLENVAFPLMLLGQGKAEALQKALEMLKQVDMEEWAEYMPTELSGGQQQRVALARGLVHNPEVIIADEPTGNLDFQSGQNVMELLSRLNRELGKTIIMVTHDLEYLRYAKNAVRMLDGAIVEEMEGGELEEYVKQVRLKR